MKINIDIKINSLCNMNCSYCGSRTDSDNIMDIDNEIIPTIDRIIDNYNDMPLNFVVLGGEVTILPNGTLTHLIDRMIESIGDKPYRIHIFTNLKVFSKELYDIYINNKNIFLDISVDSHLDELSSRDIPFDTLVKHLVMYEDMSRVVINSTLSNIRVADYRDFVMSLYKHGVKIFKIKFERLQGFYIEQYGGKEKFINTIHETIRTTPSDIKFVSNALLNTVLVQDVYDKEPGFLAITIELHSDGKPERMYRSVFDQVVIPDEREYEYYL